MTKKKIHTKGNPPGPSHIRRGKGRKQVNVRVRPEIYDALTRAAEKQHRSRNALCNLIFEQWLTERMLETSESIEHLLDALKT